MDFNWKFCYFTNIVFFWDVWKIIYGKFEIWKNILDGRFKVIIIYYVNFYLLSYSSRYNQLSRHINFFIIWNLFTKGIQKNPRVFILKEQYSAVFLTLISSFHYHYCNIFSTVSRIGSWIQSCSRKLVLSRSFIGWNQRFVRLYHDILLVQVIKVLRGDFKLLVERLETRETSWMEKRRKTSSNF